MTGDQHAVGGGDEVGLEVVGAEPGGQLVGGQRVLGSVARGAPVTDDDGPLTCHATSLADRVNPTVAAR